LFLSRFIIIEWTRNTSENQCFAIDSKRTDGNHLSNTIGSITIQSEYQG